MPCVHCAGLFSPATELRRIEADVNLGDFFLICTCSATHRDSVCAEDIVISAADDGDLQAHVNVRFSDTPSFWSSPPCSPYGFNLIERSSDLRDQCVICNRSWRSWLNVYESWVILRLRRSETQKIAAVELIFVSPSHDGFWKEVICFPYARPKVLQEADASGRSVLQSSSILWTQSTLRRCLSHPTCNNVADLNSNNQSGPSRLLLVQIHSDVCKVRLVETSSMRKPPQYYTLSHCWGGSDIVSRLTRHNHTSYKDGIPWNALPRTFQEALMATAALDEMYLWIDALCIVQDDPEDWAREAPRMADIYANGLVNLAAASSTRPDEGLFNQDRRLVREQIYLPWAEIPDADRVWDTEAFDLDLYSKHVARSTLAQRAWVFQERALSPRTLYFSRDQLWWECHSQVSNETRGRNIVGDPIASSKSMGDEYIPVVALYANKELTYSFDRLVAFSAVAQMWASRHRLSAQEYLAGLWRKDLLPQLLWSWFEPAATMDDGTYVAPSWSWAARGVAGVLTFQPSPSKSDFHLNTDIRIVEATVKYKDYNPYGLALSGHILLQCNLSRVHIATEGTSVLSVGGREQGAKERWRWDVRLDHIVIEPVLACFILPIAIDMRYGQAQGLLLRPTSASEATFKRVGLVVWWMDSSKLEADKAVHTGDFRTPDGQMLGGLRCKKAELEMQIIKIV